MAASFATLNPTPRTLLGPGPSDIHPRVLNALAAPTIGHLDPEYLAIMDEIQDCLRQVFQTENELTMPVSATGSAGMETCLVNTIEPGDRVVIAKNGVFGGRMADIVQRIGGQLVLVEVPFGQAINPEDVRKAIDGQPTKLVGVVHAETSTGVCQPIEPIVEAAHEVDALCLVDCVTSLGGMPVEIDNWNVDLAYAGTQKCLSCPPGLAPITLNERAVEVVKNRKSKVVSWYLDLNMLLNYWGGPRAYHHTAPINMNYALREALIMILEQGLDVVFARHLVNHQALVAGLEAMGLSMLVSPELRLPMLNTVCIPDGVDDAAVRKTLLNQYNIEIGAGLGDLAGKVWRVGLMGYASRRENVLSFLAALEAILSQMNAAIHKGSALEAAAAVWSD